MARKWVLTRRTKHIGGLLSFLPLGPTVLEPNLRNKDKKTVE